MKRADMLCLDLECVVYGIRSPMFVHRGRYGAPWSNDLLLSKMFVYVFDDDFHLRGLFEISGEAE